MTRELTTALDAEIRATADGPCLYGLMIAEGRAARTRREVFAPGSIDWPASGIEIRIGHYTEPVARAVPTREGAEVRIVTPATPEIYAAHAGGKTELSIEFHSLAETRTAGGIREIQSAIVTGCALVPVGRGDYGRQAKSEIRERETQRLRVYL